MALKTLKLQGPAGGYYVTDPALAYADVITVKRQGSRYYQIEAVPTGDENSCYHDASIGRIFFSPDHPFNFSELDETGARIIELVHIIYKAGDGTLVEGPPLTP